LTVPLHKVRPCTKGQKFAGLEAANLNPFYPKPGRIVRSGFFVAKSFHIECVILVSKVCVAPATMLNLNICKSAL